MEHGGNQMIQREILEKEREISQENFQWLNLEDAVKKDHTQRIRAIKPKRRFSMRTKGQKIHKKLSRTIGKDMTMPVVPKKIFRVLLLLRHDRFFQVVTSFFTPIKKLQAWNFNIKSNKKNKRC